MLKASTAKRKILVFEDDLHPTTKKSLAELFARRGKPWLGDVEVWRFLNGEFTQVALMRNVVVAPDTTSTNV